MPFKMFPKYTARHCSKPPVHWSLMSKADPRCCAKAAVDAARVPTPGAPGGKGCSSTLLSLIGSRWHIIKNPVINPKCYGFLNLVFDKARKRHKGSSKKGARPKSTASSSYSILYNFFFIEGIPMFRHTYQMAASSLPHAALAFRTRTHSRRRIRTTAGMQHLTTVTSARGSWSCKATLTYLTISKNEKKQTTLPLPLGTLKTSNYIDIYIYIYNDIS